MECIRLEHATTMMVEAFRAEFGRSLRPMPQSLITVWLNLAVANRRNTEVSSGGFEGFSVWPERVTCYRRQKGDGALGKPSGRSDPFPTTRSLAALALGRLSTTAAYPCPSAAPDLPALFTQDETRPRTSSSYTAGTNAMGTNKREPTLEDLLSDPVMATLLEHAQQTPDDMRAMMRDAWDRLARASEPHEAKE